MKTAVIITGHMRSFERCLPTIHWHVLRHFPDAAFFVATVNDADAKKAELLRARYPSAQIEIDAVSQQPELPLPVGPTASDWTVGRMYGHEPYQISVHPQAVLRQLWQLNRGWELYVSRRKQEADVVIRLRPDLWFRSCEHSMQRAPAHRAFLDLKNVAITPWWGRFGGVNDRFGIMGSKAAEAYFATYASIPALLAAGCPLHPESLIKASVEAAGCVVDDTLRAEFATLRSNGELRAEEISSVDLGHAALS